MPVQRPHYRRCRLPPPASAAGLRRPAGRLSSVFEGVAALLHAHAAGPLLQPGGLLQIPLALGFADRVAQVFVLLGRSRSARPRALRSAAALVGKAPAAGSGQGALAPGACNPLGHRCGSPPAGRSTRATRLRGPLLHHWGFGSDLMRSWAGASSIRSIALSGRTSGRRCSDRPPDRRHRARR